MREGYHKNFEEWDVILFNCFKGQVNIPLLGES